MTKDKKSDNAMDAIRTYLDERAAHDPQFAVSYGKEHKSLKECYAYIVGEARKRAVGNACCMTSEEVFGLAVHYYDEDDIKVNTSRGGSQSKSSRAACPDKKKDRPSEKKTSDKPSKSGVSSKEKERRAAAGNTKEQKVVQLELFDWDDL